MHTESAEQGRVNLRGQGQRSSQGQMTKITYFMTKRTVILIATIFYVQLQYYIINTCFSTCRPTFSFTF